MMLTTQLKVAIWLELLAVTRFYQTFEGRLISKDSVSEACTVVSRQELDCFYSIRRTSSHKTCPKHTRYCMCIHLMPPIFFQKMQDATNRHLLLGSSASLQVRAAMGSLKLTAT